MRVFNAFSSIFSPSWKSMARRVFPSRLELKRPEGSFRDAPFAKVIFTAFLYVSPVQIIPSCDHTGTPLHFHSSTTSGSASFTRARSRLSISPRQSPSSLIFASMSFEGDSSAMAPILWRASPESSGRQRRSGQEEEPELEAEHSGDDRGRNDPLGRAQRVAGPQVLVQLTA